MISDRLITIFLFVGLFIFLRDILCMENEPLNNEKRNKSKDKKKERKRHPYRRTYHKGNTPIQEEIKGEQQK